ncbi:hypothetical protein AB4Y42_21985 [Paraburkholderia sp. EG286B]|uniref:hypothetical protein n=1 Tax=Paraburkholderia sp. EG286B TaxID=3237011 RepID=UPI0034D15B1E
MPSTPDEDSTDGVPLPWEDPVIIALRDLQWMKHARDSRRSIEAWLRNPGDEEAQQSAQKAIQQLNSPPDMLLKLDGNAESASGDVLTSSRQKYFLLEVKAGERAMRSERDKFMARFMKSLESKAGGDVVISFSKRGHHLLFPEVRGRESKLGEVSVHRINLLCTGYYETIVRNPADPRPLDRLDAAELLWGTQTLGLDLSEMSAYLRALSEAHDGDGGAGSVKTYPLKVIIARSDGLYYPCGDLAAFHRAAHDFGAAIGKVGSAEIAGRAEEHYKMFKHAIRNYRIQIDSPEHTPGTDIIISPTSFLDGGNSRMN